MSESVKKSVNGRLPENEKLYFPYTNKSARDLRELSAQVHYQNVDAGWWDGFEDQKRARKETCLMLVLTELSEAVEADRKNLGSCKHLPQYSAFSVELADALIRLLDIGYVAGRASDLLFTEDGSYKLSPFLFEIFKEHSVVEQLWLIASAVTAHDILGAVERILALAEIHDIPIVDIAVEKMEYNKTRLDHKKSEREKVGGKKY